MTTGKTAIFVLILSTGILLWALDGMTSATRDQVHRMATRTPQTTEVAGACCAAMGGSSDEVMSGTCGAATSEADPDSIHGASVFHGAGLSGRCPVAHAGERVPDSNPGS